MHINRLDLSLSMTNTQKLKDLSSWKTVEESDPNPKNLQDPPKNCRKTRRIRQESKVYILLPAVISRWTANSTPWALAMHVYPWKVLLVRPVLLTGSVGHLAKALSLVTYTPKPSKFEKMWIMGQPKNLV